MKQPAETPQSAPAKKKALPAQPVSVPIKTITGLPELFANGLKEMYWAENHLVKSIPKIINAAGSAQLKQALTNHQQVTKQHAVQLENAIKLLDENIEAKRCDACKGLVMSGEHVIENTFLNTEARDFGIIISALKVENFEISSYTGLIKLAQTLGKNEVADLLQKNLTDETETANQLIALSKR